MSDPHLRSIHDTVRTAPTRSGQPWSEEDYESLVTLVKDGADYAEIAAALHRSELAIAPRLRRLLPLAERRCPADRVLPAVRDHLDDTTYQWRQIMLLSEPPRPIEYPPPIHRAGLPGLENADLTSITYALLCVYREPDEELLGRIAEEIESRNLMDRVVARRTEHLMDRSVDPGHTRYAAEEIAWRWALSAPAWKAREPDSSTGRHRSVGPYGFAEPQEFYDSAGFPDPSATY